MIKSFSQWSLRSPHSPGYLENLRNQNISHRQSSQAPVWSRSRFLGLPNTFLPPRDKQYSQREIYKPCRIFCAIHIHLSTWVAILFAKTIQMALDWCPQYSKTSGKLAFFRNSNLKNKYKLRFCTNYS